MRYEAIDNRVLNVVHFTGQTLVAEPVVIIALATNEITLRLAHRDSALQTIV